MAMIKRHQQGMVNGFLPLRSPCEGRAHLKIPKCGTNTVGRVLQDRDGWTVYVRKQHPSHDSILDDSLDWTALVRHPVDRWLSGFAQCYNRGAERWDIEQAIDTMVHDTHTTRQCDWLVGFEPKLFKLENIQKLWSYLSIEAHAHEQKRMWLTPTLEERHEAAIMAYYADDMELYERAE